MQTHSPTIVLFGATGNLAGNKIFPALSSLLLEGFLDTKTRIIAVSRREWNSREFCTFIQESSAGILSELLPLIEYVSIDFENKREYETLSHLLRNTEDKNLLVYLSLAPKFFSPLIKDLRDAAILKKGLSKLLLEKPFGTSEHSAHELRDLLESFLSPEQIFPIDHYLGKATVQALMRIHETDPSLRELLSNKTIAHVTVGLFESKGIEGRGASYDHVGALRDVGQNHMLEMLAVLMAEYPKTDAAADWQDARAVVLESLESTQQRHPRVRTGQYDGYLLEKGVDARSITETAFDITASFTRGELEGIPIRLVTGKALPQARVFLEVTFRDRSELPKNITFEVQPNAGITRTEHDGTTHIAKIPEEYDAYTNVLLDALHGERRHFPSMREIIAAWHFTDHLLEISVGNHPTIYSAQKPFL